MRQGMVITLKREFLPTEKAGLLLPPEAYPNEKGEWPDCVNFISLPDREPEPVGERRHRLTPELKAKVWEKTAGHCKYCGRRLNPFREFSVDHVIPVSKGGGDDIDNLVPACRSCNISKGDREVPAWTR